MSYLTDILSSPDPVKRTYIKVSPTALKALLGLPEEASITAITYEPLTQEYSIFLKGVGYVAEEGQYLTATSPGVEYIPRLKWK